MSASPARLVALEAVTRVRDKSSYAHETLAALLDRRKLDPRDVAFATRLAYGTIACRGTLDAAVGRYLSQPGRLEPRVADALAVTAYELLFARTPARAAVSEGVELVRSVQPKASGLANAVLRKLAESAEKFPWGDPESDAEALARSQGHPQWLADLWIDELGFETASAVMAANNEPAPLFLAHLPFELSYDVALDMLTRDGVDPEPCPVPGCIVAGSSSAAVKSTALARSIVAVADAGAQFAASVTVTEGAHTVVELGAGRGTKSLIIAGIAHLTGTDVRITAVDTHRFKLQALSDAIAKVGAKGIRTVVADATDPHAEGLPEPASADAVLVDAPCSGLGTLRRHPDRRWRARPDEIETLAELGSKLLATAAVLVKPGGFVVYSTCTIARRENAEVIAAFLASDAGRGFATDSLAPAVPEEWARFVTPEGYFQSLPEPGGPDGHFVARLRRDS